MDRRELLQTGLTAIAATAVAWHHRRSRVAGRRDVQPVEAARARIR